MMEYMLRDYKHPYVAMKLDMKCMPEDGWVISNMVGGSMLTYPILIVLWERKVFTP